MDKLTSDQLQIIQEQIFFDITLKYFPKHLVLVKLPYLLICWLSHFMRCIVDFKRLLKLAQLP